MDGREQLVVAVRAVGFPAELGELLASELRSDAACERLAKYVRAARPKSAEEIVDEMLAIRDLNRAWRDRKIAEHAEAAVTRFYNREREDDE